ncbi:aminotransferase class V-fold PLP-dependent enzyme [Streptomyces shenzhenensis]|uniref:aminotransferase class V-fold PLP-dependent enzyme n=1 Tax=Streptomyces shenzhenensis TaxID=943815 RepID=UPI003674569F
MDLSVNTDLSEARGVVGSALAPVDVAAERARTIGATYSHHLNSAGSALPTRTVVESVIRHLRQEEKEGGYEASAARKDDIEAVYVSAARLIGAEAEEIALVDSATTGLRVIVDALRFGAGTRFLVNRSTYVSHALHLLSICAETGAELHIVPNGEDGALDLRALEELLAVGRGSSDVLCVAHVPTSSGLVEPIVEIGALARRYGALYLLDATQSVGHLPVHVAEIGCDALVTTGRKFLRAPRGTGFAYVRRSLLENLTPVAPDVRGAVWSDVRRWELSATARRFETFESPVASRLGLGVALDELLARGIDATAGYLIATAAALRDELANMKGVTVQDPAACASGIVTFTVDGLSAEDANRRLAAMKVRTVSVPASHGQWDLGLRGVASVVRASVHVYNDSSDTRALLDAVGALAGGRA